MLVLVFLVCSVRAEYYYYRDEPPEDHYNYYKLTDVVATTTSGRYEDENVVTQHLEQPIFSQRYIAPGEINVQDALKMLFKGREVTLFASTTDEYADGTTDDTSWQTDTDEHWHRNVLFDILSQLDEASSRRDLSSPSQMSKIKRAQMRARRANITAQQWIPVDLTPVDLKRLDSLESTIPSTEYGDLYNQYKDAKNETANPYVLENVLRRKESLSHPGLSYLSKPDDTILRDGVDNKNEAGKDEDNVDNKNQAGKDEDNGDNKSQAEMDKDNVENKNKTGKDEDNVDNKNPAEMDKDNVDNKNKTGKDEDNIDNENQVEIDKDNVDNKNKTGKDGDNIDNENQAEINKDNVDNKNKTGKDEDNVDNENQAEMDIDNKNQTEEKKEGGGIGLTTTEIITTTQPTTALTTRSRRRKTKTTKKKRRKTTRIFTYSTTTSKSRRRKTKTHSTESTTTSTTTTTQVYLDIPKLMQLITNLTMDYSMNLTDLVNKTLQDVANFSCPTPTTTTELPTTVPTTTADPYGNLTGTIMAKCFVCGLDEPMMPRHARCADAFAGDFIPLVPVEATARKMLASYRKYCRWMNVPKYFINETDPRSMWGRWTGGCSVRWIDISGIYTQRTCRNRHRAVMGNHWASKRMAKLEMAMQRLDTGCIISPMASLVPLSRGISLYARFHVCVCTGSWCNPASTSLHSILNKITTPLIIVTLLFRL